jgi:fructokinase
LLDDIMNQAAPPLIGALEAGGTKCVCAVGTGPDDVRAVERIPTTTPAETLGRCVSFFRAAEAAYGAGRQIAAWGVATFGPAQVRRGAADFGCLTTTPKAGWGGADMLGPLRAFREAPCGFDTDVNGAALAEARWGAGAGMSSVLYLTIGTGIGGGLCVHGRPLHGLSHTEMGHVWVPRADPSFAGTCPYHGACLEGLASGPALAARWGQPAESLPEDHPAWTEHIEHLAYALAGFICTLSPEIILIGGGVGGRSHLFPPLRHRVATRINGYAPLPEIRPPGLGDHAGVLGALALGLDAATPASRP